MTQPTPAEQTLHVADEVFPVHVLRPGQVPSFDAALEIVAGRAARHELTVIEDDPTLYGSPDRFGARALVNSIPPAATVRIGDLLATVDRSHSYANWKWVAQKPTPWAGLSDARLVSHPEAIRYVCASSVDADRASARTVESVEIRTDFSQFAHLWLPLDTSTRMKFSKDPRDEGFRVFDAMGIGRSMAQLHEHRVFWIDAHRKQFAWQADMSKMIVFDLDDQSSAWPLYRKPSAPQCATMLVPLLSFFDPAEFDAFMRAYIHERGDDGWDVLNYLKVDDRTGWLRRYELGDYQGAVERILKQYQNVEEPAFPGSARTLLAMSYSRLGDSAKAVQVYEDALVVFPDDATVVHFNLGSHYQRTGDAARATEQFREVVRRERENSTMPELLAAALQRLSNGLP